MLDDSARVRWSHRGQRRCQYGHRVGWAHDPSSQRYPRCFKNKHLSHISAREKVIYQSLAVKTISIACHRLLRPATLSWIISSSPRMTKSLLLLPKVIQIVSNIVNNAMEDKKAQASCVL
jgi:hypothetical protein